MLRWMAVSSMRKTTLPSDSDRPTQKERDRAEEVGARSPAPERPLVVRLVADDRRVSAMATGSTNSSDICPVTSPLPGGPTAHICRDTVPDRPCPAGSPTDLERRSRTPGPSTLRDLVGLCGEGPAVAAGLGRSSVEEQDVPARSAVHDEGRAADRRRRRPPASRPRCPRPGSGTQAPYGRRHGISTVRYEASVHVPIETRRSYPLYPSRTSAGFSTNGAGPNPRPSVADAADSERDERRSCPDETEPVGGEALDDDLRSTADAPLTAPRQPDGPVGVDEERWVEPAHPRVGVTPLDARGLRMDLPGSPSVAAPMHIAPPARDAPNSIRYRPATTRTVGAHTYGTAAPFGDDPGGKRRQRLDRRRELPRAIVIPKVGMWNRTPKNGTPEVYTCTRPGPTDTPAGSGASHPVTAPRGPVGTRHELAARTSATSPISVHRRRCISPPRPRPKSRMPSPTGRARCCP